MFASKDHKRFKRSQAPLLLHTKWSNSFWYFSALAGEFVLSSYPLVIWRASWEKPVLLLFPNIGEHLSTCLNVNKFYLPPFPWRNLGRCLEAWPEAVFESPLLTHQQWPPAQPTATLDTQVWWLSLLLQAAMPKRRTESSCATSWQRLS